MERVTGHRGLCFQARPDALARQYAANLDPEPVRRRMNDGGLPARAGSFQTGPGRPGTTAKEGCGLTW
jgi:hypothetical protein